MIIGRDQVKKLDQDINKSSKFIKKQIFKFHFPKTKKIKVDNEKLILLGVVMGIRQRSIGPISINGLEYVTGLQRMEVGCTLDNCFLGVMGLTWTSTTK